MNIVCMSPEVVDHDGRPYLLVDLVYYLPKAFTRELEETAPPSAQAFWDGVVHRWPHAARLAAEAVDRDWAW